MHPPHRLFAHRRPAADTPDSAPGSINRVDPDLVERLVQATRELGVEVHLNMHVERIEKPSDRVLVHTSNGQAARTFEANIAVLSAGRVPEIDDLDLEAADIAWEKSGVSVNEYLQSISNPAVYAAGDAVVAAVFPSRRSPACTVPSSPATS